MRSQSSGFSLIEIVIAVAIMAIISAIVIPNLMKYVRRARKHATLATLKTVKNVITEFKDDTRHYPTELNELVENVEGEKGWDGPYIKKLPLDGWKEDLVYILEPKGTRPPYQLYSWGSGGEGSPEEEWIYVDEGA